MLKKAAYKQLENIIYMEEYNKKDWPATFVPLTKTYATQSSWLVFLVYLFSPATILPCVGLSTTVFTNALIAWLSVVVCQKNAKLLTCILGALISCNVLHYSTIVVPAILCIEQSYILNSAKKQRDISKDHEHNLTTPNVHIDFGKDDLTIYSSSLLYITAVATLIGISYLLCNYSFDFMLGTYLFS